MITVNAVIKSVSLRLDRDMWLCLWMDLDYGGTGQGFGGFVLGGVPDCAAGNHAEQTNFAGEYIVRCFMAAGVDSLNDMVSKTIRVKKTDEWGAIIAIGHIIKNDCWFDPKETAERMKSKPIPATAAPTNPHPTFTSP